MTDHIGDTNEMVFTDDDLKQLKNNFRTNETWYMDLQSEQMEALLARLEAAEHIIELCDGGDANRHHASENYQKAYEIWRKAAGK